MYRFSHIRTNNLGIFFCKKVDFSLAEQIIHLLHLKVVFVVVRIA